MIGTGTLLESLVFMNLDLEFFFIKNTTHTLPGDRAARSAERSQSSLSTSYNPYEMKVEKRKETKYNTQKGTRSYRIWHLRMYLVGDIGELVGWCKVTLDIVNED